MYMNNLKIAALESMENVLAMGTLDFSTFMEVLEYVYGNTPNRFEANRVDAAPRDKLRAVVSARCCSNIEKWVTFNEFLKMAIRNGEFAVDMLCQLKSDRTALDGMLFARTLQKAREWVQTS